MRHFLTSLSNSALVTILTSLTMTLLNTHTLVVHVWLINWLVSWFIVFNYVYFVAPKITQWILTHYE